MMRRLTAVAAGMGVLWTASLAHAQAHGNFGQQGQFILSADRLFSLFAYTHISQDAFTPPAGATKQTINYNDSAIGLLWGSSGGLTGNLVPVNTFYTVPRVGFDYVLIPNVTVGGEIVLFFTVGGSNGADTTLNNGSNMSTSTDNPGALIFGFAPRGGYILPLSDLFSLWLRGGVSYYIANQKTTTTLGNNTQQTTTITTNQFALDLDPQFVITPVPHLGFTAGLTGDIPLAGGHSQDTNTNTNGTTRSQSASAWSSVLFIGVTVGMLGYF